MATKDKEYWFKYFMRSYIQDPSIMNSELEDFNMIGEKNYRINFSYGIERKLRIDMFESLTVTEGIVKALKQIIKEKEKQNAS
jgi:hypothetical protein